MNRVPETEEIPVCVPEVPVRVPDAGTAHIPEAGNSPASRALIAMVRFYQREISPMYPRRCNFYPTCSRYALQALQKYGAVKGSYLAARRILRCNPFHRGGYDPVP